jgi:hypothetical protein
MSIRKLFDKQIPQSIVSSTNMEDLGKSVESSGNIQQRIIEKNRFIPQVNFAQPENFAKFGSAKKYYSDSFDRIANQYPYDGSLKERTEYLNNSTYLDLYIFDNVYPRTTGYATISPNGWGTVTDTFLIPPTVTVGKPSILEYVQVIGGPHTASGGMIGKELTNTFENSNYYDPDKNRESNLKCDFDDGVTIEFWMLKSSDSMMTGSTDLEVPVMLSNGVTGSVTVGLFTSGSTDPSAQRILFAANDDTTLVAYGGGGSAIPLSSDQMFDGRWHHYAFSVQNSASFVKQKVYFDGALIGENITAATLSEVTGALKLNVGAAREGTLTAGIRFPSDGFAKLSGSIDEFRYWKTARTSEEIGRYWFTQYGGGTNNDDANTDLGVYLKFNEGITGIEATDSIALDYSGRISNGTWVGYTEQGRSTGSAMDLYLGKESEFKDPIIYSSHPQVKSQKIALENSGSLYDTRNNASIYYTMPSWITEEDESSGEQLLNLTQILSSYLDTLYLQIENYPKLKDVRYPGSETKPLPFSYKLLEGMGLSTSEIFVDSTILEQIANRNEDMKFDADLSDIKNLIYKNIYNNLTYIYKSKGNMKSFRNLMRCYGIDTDLVKINLYGDNSMYRYRDNFEVNSTRKKYVDFNNPDRFEGSIYQQTASTDPSSVSFITGSGLVGASARSKEGFTSFTLESEVIFPRKLDEDQPEYFVTSFLSASLFGYHRADPNTPTDFTWAPSDVNASVYAVREGLESKNVKFVIESTYGLMPFALETDLFYDVYDNEKWNFAVRVSPDVYGGNLVSGTLGPTCTVEFYGVNSDAGTVKNEFLISTSSVDLFGMGHLSEPKRIYAGAHRTNFTGSIIEKTDVKLGTVRYWASYLNNEVIKTHARDPENFGTLSPHKSTYLYPIDLAGVKIPEMETLALNWAFDTLTGSSAAGTFAVPDLSSGSAELSQRYKTFGPIINLQHPGEAEFFPTDSTKVLDTRFVYSGKQTLPENIQSSDMINIDEQDNIFKLTTRPIDYFFSIEKSMYQNISEEILNVFATIVDFNTLVGDPVNRYRQEYKQLSKLRELFFERVQNEPDLDRYIDFYKWIDNSLSNFLNQLIPASAQFSDNMRTMVESHVLERNKYLTKFPTLDMKTPSPEGGLNAINELLYDWGTGHKPLGSPNQSENCFWWNERAERQGGPYSSDISSGDAAVDSNRNSYLSASLQVLNRSFSTPYRFSVKKQEVLVGGSNFYENKIVSYAKNIIPWVDKVGGSTGIYITSGNVEPYVCDDLESPIQKRKLKFGAYTTEAGMTNSVNPYDYKSGKGDRFVPFSIYSSSYTNTYSEPLIAALGHNLEITNNHTDTYGATMGTPMQGPFTEKFVGGMQSRHIDLNDGTDNQTNRAEQWQIKTSTGVVKIARQPIGRPRAMLFRDNISKSPVNIRNIKQATGAKTGFVSGTLNSNIGNFRKIYEVVQAAGGRTANNRAWVRNGPWSLLDDPSDTNLTASTFVGGMFDAAEPQRGRTGHVFVCRFSAPGGPDTMGDSNGGPGLDRYAAEFSPNNDLNWRNNAVREPLRNYMLTPHVNQFGYYSGVASQGIPGSTVNATNYSGTGSTYQINRNTRRVLKQQADGSVITSSAHDNYYIQHPIPATDLAYSWITSSVETITPAAFGYWPKNYYAPSLTDAFLAPVSWPLLSDTNTQVDFAGMNNYIYEPIPSHYTSAKYKSPSGKEYISFDLEAAQEAAAFDYDNIREYRNQAIDNISVHKILYTLNAHRYGPYGNSSFRQSRTGRHPIARYLRRNNFIGCTQNRYISKPYQAVPRLVENVESTFFYEPAVQKVSTPFEWMFGVDSNPGRLPGGCGPNEEQEEKETTQEIVSLGASIINAYGFLNPELANCAAGLKQIVRLENQDDPNPNDDRGSSNGCLEEETPYGTIKEWYLNGGLDGDSPVKSFVEAIYNSPFFPAALNKFRDAIRRRKNFRNRVYMASRRARTQNGRDKF